MSVNTADLGILISEQLQACTIDLFDWSAEDVRAIAIGGDVVASVDVSDPHNPIITTGSGEIFVVQIVRKG